MKKLMRTVAGLVLSSVVAGTAGLGIAQADVDFQNVQSTPDGLTLTVTQSETFINAVSSLDSSPFSREAFLNGNNIATVQGPAGAAIAGASFEAGYEVGYPVAFAPTGVQVSLTTPDLSVNGGLNAGVTPNISGGNTGVSAGIGLTLGATAGVSSTIIPAQSLSFTVEHGGVKDVPLAALSLSSPMAYANFSGVHMMVSGAWGQVTVRPYAKLTVLTAQGQSSVVVYGEPVRL
ncbi:MAG: MspA family porin [Mycobacteriaceae bacterium]